MEGAADQKPDVKTEGQSEHINLKVVGSDGTEVHFKIKRSTQLKKLKAAFCSRQGMDPASTRFKFDGTDVQDTDTPAVLDMEDGDTIDVYQQQTGGAFC
eukprot:m.354695 g.354695  ORF g.354695 m.354695 type:complete len:99 (+) comp17082_c0_seq1:149-445(+)